MNRAQFPKNGKFSSYFRFPLLGSNALLNIGFYGVLVLLLIAILTPWIANTNSITKSDLVLLMPAWDEMGRLNHLLGTDQNGRDIFQDLLWSFQTSLFTTSVISFLVIFLGSLISLIAVFIKPLSNSTIIFFKMITTIPPLLMTIIIAMLNGNTLANLIMSIIISMLPKFIYNLYHMIRHEFKKSYTTALRLDGLSSFEIMWHCVMPNILPNYITECVHCYIISLLSLTTLTFLGFGSDSHLYELGIMMHEMIEIMPFNQWGFLAPGLTIMMLVVLLNFFNFGLQQHFSQQN